MNAAALLIIAGAVALSVAVEHFTPRILDLVERLGTDPDRRRERAALAAAGAAWVCGQVRRIKPPCGGAYGRALWPIRSRVWGWIETATAKMKGGCK